MQTRGDMMAIFWYILIAYISIFIHEMGHYSSAYFFGVKATDVITGMGFKVISFKTKYTTFTFNIIPGGGMTIYPQSQELKLSRYKQFIILGSGVTFNYLAAILATTFYFETSLLNGFMAFNEMIFNFIQTLFTLFSFNDMLTPQVGMTDSIELIANQFTTIKFILFIFIFMNLLLFLFNLLPIPFFDGGQMLSLYTDPLLYKIGISAKQLNLIKTSINQLVGILLITIACLPIINEIHLYLTQNHLSTQVMIKWALIIIGTILIKRLLTSIIQHFKLNK